MLFSMLNKIAPRVSVPPGAGMAWAAKLMIPPETLASELGLSCRRPS